MGNARSMRGQFMPLLLVLAAVYFLYKKFFGAPGTGLFSNLFGTTVSQAAEQKTAEVIAKIPVSTSDLTFTVNQAKLYAQRLETAMNPISGLSPDYDGTDEDEIFSVFAFIKNKNDAKQIYKSFGLRPHTTNWLLDNKSTDLLAWLREELSTSDLNKISTKINWMKYE